MKELNCFTKPFNAFVLNNKNTYEFIWRVFFSHRVISSVCPMELQCIDSLQNSPKESPRINNDDDNSKRGLLDVWQYATKSVCIISFNPHSIPRGGIVILYLTYADWVFFALSTWRWSWISKCWSWIQTRSFLAPDAELFVPLLFGLPFSLMVSNSVHQSRW